LYSPTTAYAYGEVFATEISLYILKRLGAFAAETFPYVPRFF